MTQKARTALSILILLQLASLGILRQINQSLFTEIQDIGLEHRLVQQALNRAHIEFLNAKRLLPKIAQQQGFVHREHQANV